MVVDECVKVMVMPGDRGHGAMLAVFLHSVADAVPDYRGNGGSIMEKLA